LVRIAPDRGNAAIWLYAAKDSTVTRLKFIMVDSNRQRVAAISAGLVRQRGVSVTESLADLAGSREGICVALVADEPGAIRATAERLKVAGLTAKIIAYAEDASPHRIVKAMAAGAADFLHWPCDTANIVAAATAATASPVD
jgi:DNA-binding NarL/FixJ family response regulator